MPSGGSQSVVATALASGLRHNMKNHDAARERLLCSTDAVALEAVDEAYAAISLNLDVVK